jgi:hypothetical protein
MSAHLMPPHWTKSRPSLQQDEESSGPKGERESYLVKVRFRCIRCTAVGEFRNSK